MEVGSANHCNTNLSQKQSRAQFSAPLDLTDQGIPKGRNVGVSGIVESTGPVARRPGLLSSCTSHPAFQESFDTSASTPTILLLGVQPAYFPRACTLLITYSCPTSHSPPPLPHICLLVKP